jgi:hypothetical protein
MKTYILAAVAAAGCIAASPSFAQTTVNFDQSSDTSFYTTQGLVLNDFTILPDTFGGAVNVPSSPNYANVNSSGSTISFVDPTTGRATTSNGFGLTVAGLSASGGYFAGGTLTFLDAAGATLGTQFFAPVGPSEGRSPIEYSNIFSNISLSTFTRAENQNGPALFPIDNVTFSLNAAGAVPEPAAWALMILGVGMVGGSMRRRTMTVRYAR